MFDDLAKQFGEVFGQQSQKMMFNMVQFHIGKAPGGEIVFDVNGADPQKVAEGYMRFSEALKKVGLIK